MKWTIAIGTSTISALLISCSDSLSPSPEQFDSSSSEFFSSSSLASDRFTDFRDGANYRFAVIGTQVWMAENLNYIPSSGNSWCYENDPGNCSIYGRLYDWATAMGISTAYNSMSWGNGAKRQGVCPAGWHLPTDEEWQRLEMHAGMASSDANSIEWRGKEQGVGTKLKADHYLWSSGVGTDDYGFSALPGGLYNGELFSFSGDAGGWWTATEGNSTGAYGRLMTFVDGDVNRDNNAKGLGSSVRCVKD